MTYDERLEAEIKRHTDFTNPEWYDCYTDIYTKLPSADTKKQAIINIQSLIEELEIAIEYLEELPEY